MNHDLIRYPVILISNKLKFLSYQNNSKLFGVSGGVSKKDTICRYYSGHALDYNINDEWYSYYYRNLNRILLEMFGNNSLEGKKIIDIGCGTGYFTQIFSDLGADIIGIDFSENMVNIANFKLSKQNHPGKCILADAEDIPFPDEYFDLVFSCGDVLDYITNEKKVFSEMYRVLKPQGLVFISVGNRANLEILWYFLSLLFPKKLRYNLRLHQIAKLIYNLSKNGDRYVEFPHVEKNGNIEYIPIRSYTYYEIKKCFKTLNIKLRFYYGFHIITSLLPYTLVSDKNSPKFIRSLAKFLTKLDQKLIDKPPFNRIGSHLLFIGEKMSSNP